MRAKVALVSDSAVCLPPKLVEELRLHVVPLELSIDGKTYLDGVDISPAEFYTQLPQLRSSPTTSAPTTASFIKAFSEAASHGDSILCLTLLSTVSATYNVAVAAAKIAQDALPDVHIEVMDTGTAAGGEGLVALAAARAATAGADIPEVKAEAQRVSQRVNLVAFLDTLEYLWKGGRVPRIAAWAGSILSIKPLLELGQGEVKPLERPRTRWRAIERLVALVRERASDGPILANVMHALALDDALSLRERLLREFDCVEVLVSEFTPVMGAHTGPGLLGIAFYREDSA